MSRGVVELTTPNEYEYEGLVEGDAVTTLNGKKITIKEKMQRKNTLELIGQEGIILKDEIVSGILRLDTKSDLKNAKDIRGLDTLFRRKYNRKQQRENIIRRKFDINSGNINKK